MDVLYRGVETTLLVAALALAAAVLANAGAPPSRSAAPISVTLPMLTVVADAAAPSAR